ncbi:RNA polymerase sigma factor RpoE [candidate division KSB3 bacterium]|uniref:RNA polymerase sigma factor RpoE n=1 Tax=candidate division KSB3 bacterium TaxID=2044937 RepID=A0A2G6E8X1_9BACT|nr:MAG: RNA polymerase sigma factor RpoE [candidate division KSB3 bacterium]
MSWARRRPCVYYGTFKRELLSNDSISAKKKTIRQKKTQSRHSDEDLVAASQRGETQAFELLILRYQRQIFNLIYQMTHNAEVVEDLGQDIFLAAFKAIKGFQSKSSFFTWLYRIAINHCKNYLVSSNRAQDFELRYQAEQDKHSGADDYERDPANRLLAKEFAEEMEKAFAQLPPEQRIVLTLCEFQGLSYQEISEIVDCPIGTVRSRLSRARAALEKALGTYL